MIKQVDGAWKGVSAHNTDIIPGAENEYYKVVKLGLHTTDGNLLKNSKKHHHIVIRFVVHSITLK